jgi:hypothetical protein
MLESPRRASAKRAATCSQTALSATVTLRKPGPDRSTEAITASPSTSSPATMSAARSPGRTPTRLASARGALHWKSARSDRRTTGSAPARSSRTRPIASDIVAAIRSSSDGTSWWWTLT